MSFRQESLLRYGFFIFIVLLTIGVPVAAFSYYSDVWIRLFVATFSFAVLFFGFRLASDNSISDRLGAVLPAQAADMGYPEAQAGYPAPPPGYYAPPPAQQQGYPPPPPPAAYGYPPPPPVEYDTYVAPPYVVAPGPYYGPGPYWRGYGPRYAYGYGHWHGYRRW
jgi:hypothetical protein